MKGVFAPYSLATSAYKLNLCLPKLRLYPPICSRDAVSDQRVASISYIFTLQTFGTTAGWYDGYDVLNNDEIKFFKKFELPSENFSLIVPICLQNIMPSKLILRNN